jgi:hypothetical protein
MNDTEYKEKTKKMILFIYKKITVEKALVNPPSNVKKVIASTA